MNHLEERERIRAAMERLFAGKSIRGEGRLTVVSLAEEAGVKRGALTHRHGDLRAEFYDRAAASNHIPLREVALLEKLADLKRQSNDKEIELARLRTEAALWARVVRGLELDNDRLRRAAGQPTLALVLSPEA